ncbi:YibE/F family protein [Micromonospora sp. NPDC000207]|uniref:YibE/F family protein n=1 Tax=Micromonospora sp. NPDC000207 TaxID=3154246 RepID=UPI0033212DBD
MGADHTSHAPSAPPRVRRVLVATVVPLFVATLVAALLLWPERTPTADGGEDVPRYQGTVTRVLTVPCPPVEPGPEGTPERADRPCGTVTVRADSGPDAGQEVETPIPDGPGAPRVAVGDEIILVELVDPADPETSSYNIAEHQRGKPLVWLVVLFAAAIVAFGRWRGLAALGGLAASFAILLTFVVPGISAGRSPLLIAVVGSALIMFIVLYLTHGISAQTSVAVLGTLGSLVLTGLLAAAATAATHLTGFGDEDATTLSMFQSDVDLHGLLLAGIVIGSLGVLDDVTVTQAATVTEVGNANPKLTALQLYKAGTRVGRAHIASVVNTIVLAYAGASLPLMLLLVADSRPTGQVLTSEFLAQEIVRSVVATLGLVAAVPLTTALAAVVTAAGRRTPEKKAARPDANPRPRPPAQRDDALEALSDPRAGSQSPDAPAGWRNREGGSDPAW